MVLWTIAAATLSLEGSVARPRATTSDREGAPAMAVAERRTRDGRDVMSAGRHLSVSWAIRSSSSRTRAMAAAEEVAEIGATVLAQMAEGATFSHSECVLAMLWCSS